MRNNTGNFSFKTDSFRMFLFLMELNSARGTKSVGVRVYQELVDLGTEAGKLQ